MRKEYDALRGALVLELDHLGRRDAIAKLDRDMRAANVPGLNPFLKMALGRMIELGVPAAVFVLAAPQARRGFGTQASVRAFRRPPVEGHVHRPCDSGDPEV